MAKRYVGNGTDPKKKKKKPRATNAHLGRKMVTKKR